FLDPPRSLGRCGVPDRCEQRNAELRRPVAQRVLDAFDPLTAVLRRWSFGKFLAERHLQREHVLAEVVLADRGGHVLYVWPESELLQRGLHLRFEDVAHTSSLSACAG